MYRLNQIRSFPVPFVTLSFLSLIRETQPVSCQNQRITSWKWTIWPFLICYLMIHMIFFSRLFVKYNWQIQWVFEHDFEASRFLHHAKFPLHSTAVVASKILVDYLGCIPDVYLRDVLTQQAAFMAWYRAYITSREY